MGRVCSVVDVAIWELLAHAIFSAHGAHHATPRSIALRAEPRVYSKGPEIGKVDFTTTARLARCATAMEFTLQLVSSCPELRSGLPFLARRALVRPLVWRARIAHKLAVVLPPLAQLADIVRRGALAASGLEVGRIQYASVADVGPLDNMEGVSGLPASRTRARW